MMPIASRRMPARIGLVLTKFTARLSCCLPGMLLAMTAPPFTLPRPTRRQPENSRRACRTDQRQERIIEMPGRQPVQHRRDDEEAQADQNREQTEFDGKMQQPREKDSRCQR